MKYSRGLPRTPMSINTINTNQNVMYIINHSKILPPRLMIYVVNKKNNMNAKSIKRNIDRLHVGIKSEKYKNILHVHYL